MNHPLGARAESRSHIFSEGYLSDVPTLASGADTFFGEGEVALATEARAGRPAPHLTKSIASDNGFTGLFGPIRWLADSRWQVDGADGVPRLPNNRVSSTLAGVLLPLAGGSLMRVLLTMGSWQPWRRVRWSRVPSTKLATMRRTHARVLMARSTSVGLPWQQAVVVAGSRGVTQLHDQSSHAENGDKIQKFT